MTSAPRIIGYVRVSTDEQAESGLGLEAQERKIRAFCELNDYDLVEIVRDEGVSGATLKRPGLRRVLRAIAKGTADGLVCAKLDRLTRSSVDMALIFEWCRDADAILALLDMPGVDTSTAIGKAISTVMGMVAELERDLISQRTKDALESKRRRGERVGQASFSDRGNGHLARRIRHMRTPTTDGGKGMTLQAIADVLNGEGVPTLRGGTTWRPSSVQNAAGYQRPTAKRKRATLPSLGR